MDINSEKIKSLRDEKLWSQDELAISSGLSLRTIQRAEREGVASLQTVKAIAAAFNVDLNLLRREVVSSATELNLASDARSSSESRYGRGRAGFALIAFACSMLGLVYWYFGQQDSAVNPKAPTTEVAQSTKVTGAAQEIRSIEKPQSAPEIQSNAQLNADAPAPARAQREAVQGSTQLATRPATQSGIHPSGVGGNAQTKPSATDVLTKLRGHWESISTGVVMTLDIDDATARFGGASIGTSNYTLVKNVISYEFGNQVISARIGFDSAQEMTWTTLESGTTFKWTRDKIVPPSREEFLAQLQGNWRGVGYVRSLEVEGSRMKLAFMDDSTIDSAYLINQQRLSVNRAGTMQHYVVSFNSPTEMIWSRTFGIERYVFVRLPATN